MPRPVTPEERERRRQAEQRKEHVLRCYLTTFTSDAGRVVLADLQRRAFGRRSVVHMTRGGVSDPMLTGVNEGFRLAFQEVLNHIEAARALDASEAPLPRQAESATIIPQRGA